MFPRFGSRIVDIFRTAVGIPFQTVDCGGFPRVCAAAPPGAVYPEPKLLKMEREIKAIPQPLLGNKVGSSRHVRTKRQHN